MSMIKIPGEERLFYDTVSKIVYERQENGDFNAFSIYGARLVTLVDQLGVALTSLGGNNFIPEDSADTDVLCGVEHKEAAPAGATKVMLFPVSGTTAVRAALGSSGVLATTTSGVRVPGTAAGTNPVDAIILSLAALDTHLSLIAESGTPTIGVVWGT